MEKDYFDITEVSNLVDSLNLTNGVKKTLETEINSIAVPSGMFDGRGYAGYPHNGDGAIGIGGYQPITYPFNKHNSFKALYETISKYDSDFRKFYETYDEKELQTLSDVWYSGQHYNSRQENKTSMDAWIRYHNLYRTIINKEPLDNLTEEDLISQIIHHKNNPELKEAWDLYYGLILIA